MRARLGGWWVRDAVVEGLWRARRVPGTVGGRQEGGPSTVAESELGLSLAVEPDGRVKRGAGGWAWVGRGGWRGVVTDPVCACEDHCNLAGRRGIDDINLVQPWESQGCVWSWVRLKKAGPCRSWERAYRVLGADVLALP
jgi:hypothetical protein